MRILVVEDEKGIAGFLKEGLEEEYFAVDVANEGTGGLEMALSTSYDLLLVDWLLPGISGIELCRRYRKENLDTPIIFLTAKDALQDIVFGLDAGANDYITKPFEFEELLARIRVQLRPKNNTVNILSIGSLQMDLSTHQVFKDDKEIVLTPKEFALLEYLLVNKGRVCTRTRIIEHVWDIQFETDTAVIDVYINFLRKKLGDNHGNPLIKTVRGIGYIIREE